MLEKVISGGQTGVDQAALRAAKKVGIVTGGWAPQGWRTEEGRSEWLADYGLMEHEFASYTDRTKANVKDSEATLLIVEKRPLTGGSKKTAELAGGFWRPYLIVVLDGEFADDEHVRWVLSWLRENNIKVLNVAGSRESKSPGITIKAGQLLVKLFEAVKTNPY